MKNNDLMKAYLSIISEAADRSPWAGRSLKTMISFKKVVNNARKHPALMDNEEVMSIVNNFQNVKNVKELIDNLNKYLDKVDDLLPNKDTEKKTDKKSEEEKPEEKKDEKSVEVPTDGTKAEGEVKPDEDKK